tara:strand:- start:206 stop:694 length:489 start_codon:yes stop_codon:yes gene_type:complete
MSYSEKPIKVPRFSEEEGFYTTAQRSRTMSKIRGKDTKPELAFRRALWATGCRYRVNDKTLTGKPAISIKKYKMAIFIDGEFWHGHNWEEKREAIKSNRDFWIPKIERNMQRDREVNQKLKDAGFTVFRFWTKELKTNFEKSLNKIVEHINFMKNSFLEKRE